PPVAPSRRLAGGRDRRRPGRGGQGPVRPGLARGRAGPGPRPAGPGSPGPVPVGTAGRTVTGGAGSRVHEIDPCRPDVAGRAIRAAVAALVEGALVVLPTETVYGL